MNRFVLASLLAGAAGTLALIAASLATAAVWRLRRHAIARLAPRRRAQHLARLRLLPGVAAAAAMLVTFTAFLRYEPLDARETVGAVLPIVFLTGAGALLAGLLRLRNALRQTSLTLRTWGGERCGIDRSLPVLAVDAPFPVVAVVGVLKPRLLVARQVVAACDRSELDAMVAHESAHVAAHDNLTRLLFAAAPVVPFTTAACCAIEDAWIGASEEAADDEARREGRSPLVLASALTKVARLATGRAPLAHASAILSGNGVEQRVRRLLEPPPREHGGRVRAPYIAAGAFALATVASPRVAHAIYDVAEYCVRHLP